MPATIRYAVMVTVAMIVAALLALSAQPAINAIHDAMTVEVAQAKKHDKRHTKAHGKRHTKAHGKRHT
jgi:hypothetical protein